MSSFFYDMTKLWKPIRDTKETDAATNDKFGRVRRLDQQGEKISGEKIEGGKDYILSDCICYDDDCFITEKVMVRNDDIESRDNHEKFGDKKERISWVSDEGYNLLYSSNEDEKPSPQFAETNNDLADPTKQANTRDNILGKEQISETTWLIVVLVCVVLAMLSVLFLLLYKCDQTNLYVSTATSIENTTFYEEEIIMFSMDKSFYTI